jgi:TldD protein
LSNAVDFFRERFQLDERNLVRALDIALERPVDYADLFFEHATRDSLVLEEGIVKSGDRHVEQGVGVRAQSGERQGYAHTDEVTLETLRLAATTARAICEGPGAGTRVSVRGSGAPAADLYPVARPPTEAPVESKLELLGAIDAHARSLDPRVKQVMASVVSESRQVLVLGSDGSFATDSRPLVRLIVDMLCVVF